MELKGEQIIKAPRDIVFAALNDPDILKESIPGCQSLTKVSDTEMEAEVGLKIGPVKATFKGAVELSNIKAPESYTIAGEGKGGAAGHAKGGADVSLREESDHTVLSYDVKAQVGGKLAQLGSRLIDSTARKLSAQFFTRFGKIVEAGQEEDEEGGGEEKSLWGRLKSSVGAG
ncbi:MAG: carbon monoxide dehydrogenase subunit G [Pseudomonadota bacterium]